MGTSRRYWVTLGLLHLAVFFDKAAGKFEHANLLTHKRQVKSSYDYIIVGGGTSGLTVADRLTEDGKYTVLVIEHGALDNSTDIARGGAMQPSRIYDITSVPQPGMNNKTQAVNVGNVVGGSSAVNGMAFMRGTSDEYDSWAELGGPNSTWNWKGVLPYFKKAAYFTPPRPEQAKAFNITYDVDAAWGQDPATYVYASYGPNQDPALIPTYNAMAKMPGVERPKDGAAGTHGLFWITSSINPTSFERSYARNGHFDNITRPNYDLVPGQRVNKILFSGSSAVGVRFVTSQPNGTTDITEVKASTEVIIAAGTIHTPQVLQLSGVGPRGLLERANISVVADLPGVGQKFQDQGWIGSMAFRWANGAGPPAPKLNLTRIPGQAPAYSCVARLGFPLITNSSDSIATAYAGQDAAAHLPQDSHPTVVAGYKAFQQLHGKALRKKNVSFFGYLINPGPGGNFMHLHTLSHGTVNIDPSAPEAEPIVDYRALSNPTDISIMIEELRFMRKFMSSDDFAPYEPIETNPGANVTSDSELEAWVRKNYIPSLYHPVGTAAKMPRELGGVVGEDLLVHGTQRLSIVDASIMPSMPGGPTSQTVYMIAEKAADIIKARKKGLPPLEAHDEPLMPEFAC